MASNSLRLTTKLHEQTEQSTCVRRTFGRKDKLNEIIPACAVEQSISAGKWANMEDIGYGV